jgi:hypothetical protein
VFETRVLRRMFRSKREEVVSCCRRLHNEKLRNLYTSPNIIKAIKSRRMRWTRHVERMGGMIKGRYHLQTLGADGKIT